ncbi:acetyl-CoA carboxylase, carboxyltransferase subunit beta [Rhabdochlamydiaceae symbiont of Dictyostelium giganteum]|uniref:acetyl-CoA carboxylase, carboxyltransferase subunit beta n=1 Tax=Rhabdochlamydiaceae symbiont of Dictyostelium giganteum TaxID=3342349 RepID=UPI00384B117C
MGLFSKNKPKIKIQSTKKDSFSGWVKCSHCNELIHANELQDNKYCCPKCDYHYRLTGLQRIELLVDAGSFEEKYTTIQPVDPLHFVDSEPYPERINRAKVSTGRDEAAIVGVCSINSIKVALGVLDFSFMAGSMGSVVGERLTSIIEYGLEHHLPVVLISASGGARMQESILSLMQMAKTSAALAKLHEQKLPYISVLTNPTTGGVTASFASLGDVIIAEPDALIGFAGPRVVEQTIGQKLPPKAQRSEFLMEKGMIDCIVTRHDLKSKLSSLLQMMLGNERNTKLSMTPLTSKPNDIPHKIKELLNLSTQELIDVNP